MATIYREDQSIKASGLAYRLDKLRDDEIVLGRLFLVPAVVYIIALVGFPFVLAIAFSVSDYTTGTVSQGIGGFNFVGLDTFKAAVNDRTFWKAFWNTIRFTVISQILVIFLANILALALHNDFRGKWFVRFLILLPWATPIALASIGWLWLLDSTFSPIDWVLVEAGLLSEQPGHAYYLARNTLARGSVILVHVWRILPLATIIIMAGLTSIPSDIKDAVAVDGVGFWRELFEVTIPLMRPILAVAGLFGIIFTFTDMTVVFILTRGGPINNTHVLSSWAFQRGIPGGALSQGAAIALFLFPVLLAAVIIMLRTARRTEVL